MTVPHHGGGDRARRAASPWRSAPSWCADARGRTVEAAIFSRHVLRNALVPVLAVLGLQAGRLMGGMVITETVFAIPGIGRLAVDSVLARDFLTVQGVVLVMAVWVLVANLLVDISNRLVDPRISRL